MNYTKNLILALEKSEMYKKELSAAVKSFQKNNLDMTDDEFFAAIMLVLEKVFKEDPSIMKILEKEEKLN